MLSPIILGVLGFSVGFVCSRTCVEGIMCLGICFGAFVGIIAAVGCIVTNRFKCTNMAALFVNLLIFITVAKELMIIE